MRRDNFAVAALDGEIEVPTLDGREKQKALLRELEESFVLRRCWL